MNADTPTLVSFWRIHLQAPGGAADHAHEAVAVGALLAARAAAPPCAGAGAAPPRPPALPVARRLAAQPRGPAALAAAAEAPGAAPR